MPEPDDNVLISQLRAWVDEANAEVVPVTAGEAIRHARTASGPAGDHSTDVPGPDRSANPPAYVSPPALDDERSQHRHLHKLLVAAGVVLFALIGVVTIIPADGPLHHLISGPDQEVPSTAPPAEARQDLVEISPDPSEIEPGSEVVVTPIGGFDRTDPETGKSMLLSGERGVTARWERWTDAGWESTHVLTAADFGPVGSQGSGRVPTPEPLVQTYDEFFPKDRFSNLVGYPVEARPFRFQVPDVGPGIYRLCLTDIESACEQIRFSGSGVPALADPNEPTPDSALAGHPGRTSWRLTEAPDGTAELDPSATTITVYADRSTCPTDTEPTGPPSEPMSIIDPSTFTPTVESSPDRVVIIIRAEVIADGTMCAVSTEPRPITVPLGEAVGDRSLIDGGCTTGAGERLDCAEGDLRWPTEG